LPKTYFSATIHSLLTTGRRQSCHSSL